MQQLLLEVVRVSPPTFENFVVGFNQELIHALKNLAGVLDEQRGERFIYLWGESGCGKSHLLQATAQALTDRQLPVRFIDCRQAVRADFEPDTNRVMVEEVEQLDNTNQIRLFNLYNQIRENRTGLFLASGTQPPAQLSLRKDLSTRLGWGLVYQVHTLTDTQKIEAMQHHATRRGFTLSQEVCESLLKIAPRNLSSLIDLINSLDQYSLQQQRPVTRSLLYQWLRIMALIPRQQ
ncbi:MAG: DnaA regulatory inactivator Hda [Nitrosomonas sp.]|nr:DnaA regulatory inactivator Hda [Nitrosomonas sp.]MCC7136302.1 DnaA regulatory inactivator Hda [Nitrosomonas sp.]